MANNDRVADVYHRRADTTATQDACRARVHWLCQQAGGGRVLDVGCSQGISALILAREGSEVVGLDIESEALAAAAEALAQEPPQVQQRVRFLQADAFTAALDPGSYDAALVAEVLEHQTRDSVRVIRSLLDLQFLNLSDAGNPRRVGVRGMSQWRVA